MATDDCSSPLQNILSDSFLTFVSENIGVPFDSFLISLGLTSTHIDHAEYDHRYCVDIILKCLHEWRDSPASLKDRNIPEIKQWISKALRHSGYCRIDDDIIEHNDIDKIIEKLSFSLTGEGRRKFFIAIGIPYKQLDDVSKKRCSLKEENKKLLLGWIADQLNKYWKYQELLKALKEDGKSYAADKIKDKYEIKDSFADQQKKASKRQSGSVAVKAGSQDNVIPSKKFKYEDGHLESVQSSNITYRNQERIKSLDVSVSQPSQKPSVNKSYRTGLTLDTQNIDQDYTSRGHQSANQNNPPQHYQEVKEAQHIYNITHVTGKNVIVGDHGKIFNDEKNLDLNKDSGNDRLDSTGSGCTTGSTSDNGYQSGHSTYSQYTSEEPPRKENMVDEETLKKLQDHSTTMEKENDLQSTEGKGSEKSGRIEDNTHSIPGTINTDQLDQNVPFKREVRKYQDELSEKALQGKSTIICAPPNAGKTIVAFQIIASHLKNTENAKVIFMTTTNPLLDQQYDKANKFEDFQTLKENGGLIKLAGKEGYTSENGKKIFQAGVVFFMTTQSLVNRLSSSLKEPAEVSDFTLLVFDECHHIIGNTPYNDIMEAYRREKFEKDSKSLPQIIGLTASPGDNKSSNEDKAERALVTMMASYGTVHLSTVRENKEELDPYINTIEGKVKLFVPRPQDLVFKILMNVIGQVENILKCHKVRAFCNLHEAESDNLFDSLSNPPGDKLEQVYELWISETTLKTEKLLKKDKTVPRLILTCLRHLKIYMLCLEMYSMLEIDAVIDLLEEDTPKELSLLETGNTEEELQQVDILKDVIDEIKSADRSKIQLNPNVLSMINLLEDEYFNKQEDSRILIYVQKRTFAKALAKYLRNFSTLKHLDSVHFTGSQVATEDGGLSKIQQQNLLREIKLGKHKCVVATTVLIEGIDIPECSLTIKYRFNTSVTAYYQMKGRVRKTGGNFYSYVIEKDQLKEMKNKERIKLMQEAINSVEGKNIRELQSLVEEKENIIYLAENAKRDKKMKANESKTDSEFQVVCRKCGEFIANEKTLRIMNESQHVVIDKSILNQVKREESHKPKFEKINFIAEAFGKCGHFWGQINCQDDTDFLVLAQKSVKIIDSEKNLAIKMKKWKDLDLNIQTIANDELIAYQADTTS